MAEITLEELHKLQEGLLAHFEQRRKLSRRLSKIGHPFMLSLRAHDVYVYDMLTNLIDQKERDAIESAIP